jgi:hypothetical protein
MTQTDPDRQKVLSDMAAGFGRPPTPTEFQITVDQAAADRVQAFAEVMSEYVGQEVPTGAVVEFAIDMLWSRWAGEI